MSTVEIITMTEDNIGKVQLFCGHSPTYRAGYRLKQEWLRERLAEGMRYLLLRVDGTNAGMLEAIPGEHDWRGVEADGYLFIHCLWVIGRNRGRGYGRQLLHACQQAAGALHGVAVLASKAHWLPTPRLFLKNGFELADHSDPCFDLLVWRNSPQAPLPRIKRSPVDMPTGLVLYHTPQCPYTQNVPEITTRVGELLGIPVQIIRLDSARAAQSCPCPYGCLAYYYNGSLLTYHPTGTKELLSMLKEKLSSN